MSKITRAFFRKLHEQLMKNEQYKSGYEYAKQHTLALREIIWQRLKGEKVSA